MGLWSFRVLQTGTSGWWVAALMEGVDKGQEICPLSARKSNIDKMRTTETTKTRSEGEIAHALNMKNMKVNVFLSNL